MIRKIFYSLLFVFFLASCGSSSLVKGTQKLELGMSKRQVVSILGDNYKVMATQTPDGSLEILRYSNVYNEMYVLHFLNGKLAEWHDEEVTQTGEDENNRGRDRNRDRDRNRNERPNRR